MKGPDLEELDLNLLRVLLALAEEGSVSSAGKRLELAQSTVSHALARLREEFNDPLFVRTTRGVQPTALAATIAPAIGRAFEMIQNAVDGARSFDPEQSDRAFVLLMIDVGEITFIPRLMTHLRQCAPNVRLIIRQIPLDQYKDALESGAADLAVGQLPSGGADLTQQFLFNIAFHGYAQIGHPILEDPSMEAFLEASHLAVDRPTMSETFIKRALGPLVTRRKVTLRLSHYSSAAAIVAETDLVAVLPDSSPLWLSVTNQRRVARFPLPFSIENVVMRQFWHPRSNTDSGNRWLRGEIVKLFRKGDQTAHTAQG